LNEKEHLGCDGSFKAVIMVRITACCNGGGKKARAGGGGLLMMV